MITTGFADPALPLSPRRRERAVELLADGFERHAPGFVQSNPVCEHLDGQADQLAVSLCRESLSVGRLERNQP
jgi:hypothetical protein